MTVRPCGIVPSRNHHRHIGEIVATLREAGLFVFVIDDASEAPSREILAALDAPGAGVSVFRFEENQGKGGAVMKGFELAAASGFSHAVQVDADGQHDLGALPRLLAAAAAEPDRLILGRPLYDASAPWSRAIGRWLTRFWVWVETLSFAVADAMCGFRVYPLAPVTAIMNETRIGRRMDFDIEIVVRLLWRGVGIREVPVGVVYPEGNTSNFDVLRDNWRITRMHTRLVFTLLWRLVSGGVRRPKPVHWAGLGERGLYWGLCTLAAIYRLVGPRACLAAIVPIVAFFHLTGRQQRAASRGFRERALAASGTPPRPLDGFRHAFDFARKALETFAAWTGDIAPGRVELATPAGMAEAEAEESGIVLVVSHLGNVELGRALLAPERRARVTALVHTIHAENYNRILRRFRPEAALNIVQVTALGPETALGLGALVEQGHWIAIAGDRTPVGGGHRVSRATFLGGEADFPQGPYLLAHLLRCPVYLLFCLREGARYRLHIEKFAHRIELPRGGKEAMLAQLARRYAERLEAYCLEAPYQWYNFFDFWAPRPVLPQSP